MKEKKINPYLKKEGDQLLVTPKGREFLSRIVTDPEGDVYAFTQNAPPLLVAASMARLSRSSNDLRVTYLNEFADDQDRAEDLINKVVTGFGDDSVTQLLGLHFVVENASNLLTKQLEWGRFSAYLEQSTRYIYFDKKINGRYRYYTPPNLTESLTVKYNHAMDRIFDSYSAMVRALTNYLRKKIPEPKEEKERAAWINATRAQACDAIRPVLPAATRSTVGIFASAQAVEQLIIHLFSETLEEHQLTGQKILHEARKVIGPFLKRVDLLERGLATVAYRANTRKAIRNLDCVIDSKCVKSSSGSDRVTLVDYWPKNELDVVAEMIYSETNLPILTIQDWLKGIAREDKEEIFWTYIGNRLNRRHKPGRAMEKMHSEWEIIGDYGTFRDLQRHRVVDMMEWQRLNVYCGYEVPKLVVEAGLEEDFRRCFAESEKLFGIMQNEGLVEESQYATLLGHKMHYRFMLNVRAAFHFHELRTGPDGHPGYRAIVNEMHDKLSAVWPLIGKAMKFVNKGEDPELTRMAAELATQNKLAKLWTSPL